jgi:fumarate reductase subunit D
MAKQPASRRIPQKNVHTQRPFLFDKTNYIIMLAGLLVFIIGLLLMVGGKSNDPNQFHPEEIYSFRRITLAPIVVILGLVIEVFAIMKKPSHKQSAEQHPTSSSSR